MESETAVYYSKAIKGGDRIIVNCRYCGKEIDLNRQDYEENIAKGAKPLCFDCGFNAFFGGK